MASVYCDVYVLSRPGATLPVLQLASSPRDDATWTTLESNGADDDHGHAVGVLPESVAVILGVPASSRSLAVGSTSRPNGVRSTDLAVLRHRRFGIRVQPFRHHQGLRALSVSRKSWSGRPGGGRPLRRPPWSAEKPGRCASGDHRPYAGRTASRISGQIASGQAQAARTHHGVGVLVRADGVNAAVHGAKPVLQADYDIASICRGTAGTTHNILVSGQTLTMAPWSGFRRSGLSMSVLDRRASGALPPSLYRPTGPWRRVYSRSRPESGTQTKLRRLRVRTGTQRPSSFDQRGCAYGLGQFSGPTRCWCARRRDRHRAVLNGQSRESILEIINAVLFLVAMAARKCQNQGVEASAPDHARRSPSPSSSKTAKFIHRSRPSMRRTAKARLSRDRRLKAANAGR